MSSSLQVGASLPLANAPNGVLLLLDPAAAVSCCGGGFAAARRWPCGGWLPAAVAKVLMSTN